jgi:hypothetical protein
MRLQGLLGSLVLALLAAGAQGFIPLATSPWGCCRGAGGLGASSCSRGGQRPASLAVAHMVCQPGMPAEGAVLGRREALRVAFAAAVVGGGASGAMADGGQKGVEKPSGEAGKKARGFGRTLVDGMLAGAVAGAAVDLALYPLDTVRPCSLPRAQDPCSIRHAAKLSTDALLLLGRAAAGTIRPYVTP